MSAPIPRGIRICNPTLIRRSPVAWSGETSGTDPDFETFGTLEDGIRAGARNFLTHWRRGDRTVAELIARHAPPVSLAPGDHNPTDAYAAFVAERCGIDPGAPIDLGDLRVLELFVAAVIDFECAHWPVPVTALRSGCARALA
jgi:hypothetical protein